MKVVIVNAGLDASGHLLLWAIGAVLENPPHCTTIVVPKADVIEGVMKESVRCLLIFAGGVPQDLVGWLGTTCNAAQVPVFIIVANAHQAARWLDYGSVTVFTTGTPTPGAQPWAKFQDTLSTYLSFLLKS